MAEGLELTVSRDGFATVRMCNGENRVRLAFTEGWHSILDEIERNNDIKALIITGNDKFFSLGLDLKHFTTQTPQYVEKTRQQMTEIYTRILHLPIPTLAAINGHAYGAGAFLALVCDFRLMRRDRGWLCWPETALGMRMKPMSIAIIRMKMGPESQRATALFGQRMTVAQARTLNLVDIVCDQDQLEAETERVGRAALGRRGLDRETLRDVKQTLYSQTAMNKPTSNM